jgi:hypothetical protein
MCNTALHWLIFNDNTIKFMYKIIYKKHTNMHAHAHTPTMASVSFIIAGRIVNIIFCDFQVIDTFFSGS